MKITTAICAGLTGLFILLLPLSIMADEADDAPMSRKEGRAILQELKGIRQLLERIEKQGRLGAGKTAKPVSSGLKTLKVKNNPVFGDKNAPLTLVEVSDYQCPFCKRFFDNTLALLKKKYVDTGKVKLVFKDLPLAFHKQAKDAALAGHCAGDQGKYWQMHDKMFANPKKLDKPFLKEYAQAMDLDMGAYQKCMDSKKYYKQIEADVAEVNAIGITGTPSFVVGKSAGDKVTGPYIRGAQPFASFQRHIDQELRKLGKH